VLQCRDGGFGAFQPTTWADRDDSLRLGGKSLGCIFAEEHANVFLYEPGGVIGSQYRSESGSRWRFRGIASQISSRREGNEPSDMSTIVPVVGSQKKASTGGFADR
jgi:hypothetical protein